MNHRNPQKTFKKSSLRPSSGLRFRIDGKGHLRARVSASAGEFQLSPEIVQLLCLLEQGVSIPSLASRLKQDFRQISSSLPLQEEVEQILQDMKEAQCVTESGPGEGHNSGLEDGFGDPWIQWAMLADQPRCSAYQRAIQDSVDEKSHVLDVGAGTGLLSLYALNAGAHCVEAIEETASARILQKIKHALPAPQKAKFFVHNKNSSDVTLSADVTHVVSELFGNDPLQEGVIHTLRDVFSRLESKKVRGIPESCEIFIQCADILAGPLFSRLARIHKVSSDASNWINPVRLIQGQMNFENISFPHPVRVSDFKVIAPLFSAFRIPLAPPPSERSPRPSAELAIQLKDDVRCPVMILCFRAHLNKKNTISNIPGQPDQCDHWSPVIVPLFQPLKKSDELLLRVGVGDDWETTMVEVKNKSGQRIGSRQ